MRATITAAADLTEKELCTQGYQLLRVLGWERFHTYRSTKSQPGYPDDTCVRERIVWIEWKAAKGRLSAAQRHWIRLLLAAGGEVYVVRPADLQDLATVLAYRGRIVYSEAPSNVGAARMRLSDSTGEEAAA